MKHFIISLVLFAVILVSAFFSHTFTNNFIDLVRADSRPLTTVTKMENGTHQHMQNIKNRFYDKKNTLQLFLNKEHIQEIETKILLLESAVENEEYEAIRQNSIELICLLDHAESSLTAWS